MKLSFHYLERSVSKLERLTKKDVFIGNYINEEVYTIGTDDESVDTAYTGKAIDRLADLEDKIESGKLVEVVRCGDCKDYWHRKCINSDSGYFEWARCSNDYCAEGERSSENAT